MAVTILTPVYLEGGTSVADVGVAVPNAHQQNRTFRVSNIGVADAYADAILTDGTTVIYLMKSERIPYQEGSVVDIVTDMLIPAGWKFRCRASAPAALGFSYWGVDRG